MRRFPDYKGPIDYINNIPYQIVATYPIERVKNAPLIKEWLGCDTAFKSNKNNMFIFCNQIHDVSYEEI